MSLSEDRVAELLKQRESELSAAQTKLARAEKSFEEKSQTIKQALAGAANTLGVLSGQIKAACDSADATLGRLGLSAKWPDEAIRSSVPKDPKEIVELAAFLSKAMKPRLWPRSEGAGWALGIGLLVSTLATQTLVPLLLWPIGYLFYLMSWKSEQVGNHSAIHQGARAAIEQIDGLKKQKAQEASSEISLAERAILVPARADCAAAKSEAEARFVAGVTELEARLKAPVEFLHKEAAELDRQAGFAALPWDSPNWQSWQPDDSPAFAAQVGRLVIQPSSVVTELLSRLPLRFSLPSLVPFANGRCLLVDAAPTARQVAAEAIHSVSIRVLATTPPGKARFIFVDPVGLGQNVADFMQLGDHDSALIGGKAWSEPKHIEQQLLELTEHMETVIQKYLRREFQSIFEFNTWAQEVAEPFRFLVIFDYPVNFTSEAARRLASIVRNGARCGVFVIVHRDSSKPLPHGASQADLEEASNRLTWNPSGVAVWADPGLRCAIVRPDSVQGQPLLVARMMEISGSQSASAMKVEVPFERLLSDDMKEWGRATSRNELKVPLGPCGARKNQHLTLGQGLAHHALIVGRTGSGKTNLMHVIMIGFALKYSPEELELYLVDFKGGVGFKPYASHRIPNARVIAIESDREFGLSVLLGLDATLKSRFNEFKAADVDSIGDFRARKPTARMPRIVLVVDEYQEFFSEDDSVAAQARAILERIVRQGRSFGIHIILGSQSLTGSAQLPQSILGQMAVRIALPCNQADARTIFSEDNSAAKVLSRPGEAVLNDAGGAVEANSPFQVARFSDSDLTEQLQILRAREKSHAGSQQVYVFDGHEPAKLNEAAPIVAALESATWAAAKTPRVWLGEAVAMAPPVEALFPARAGRNLLVVTRDESEGVGVVHAAWMALLMQHRPTTASFVVLDYSTADEPWAEAVEKLQDNFEHQVRRVRRHDLPGVLEELVKAVQSHSEAGRVEHRTYFTVVGLHRARDLRPDPEMLYRAATGSNADLFGRILRDGPEAGVHTLAWCDSVQNCKRAVDRNLAEFGLRVAGPMAVDDSNALLDGPFAAKLNRPHRMVFLDEERPGVSVKLRPYAIPDFTWLERVGHAQRSWTVAGQ